MVSKDSLMTHNKSNQIQSHLLYSTSLVFICISSLSTFHHCCHCCHCSAPSQRLPWTAYRTCQRPKGRAVPIQGFTLTSRLTFSATFARHCDLIAAVVFWEAAVPCSAKMLSQLVMGFFKANLRLPALWLSCGSGQMDHLQSAACVYIRYELITYNIRIYDYTYNISLSLFLFICTIYCFFWYTTYNVCVYSVYIYVCVCV